MRIVGFSSYSLAANQPMKSITEADKKQLTPEEAHLQFCLNVGRLWIARPYYGENCHFSGISERFMGFMGIVHGIQWEICHQLGMIFGFGTRQC